MSETSTLGAVAPPPEPGSHLPVAEITEEGKLRCTRCGKDTYPRLIEPGYVVTHDLDLDALAEGRWEATGWDGSSKAVTECGDYLALECHEASCTATYRLPAGAELEWK